MHPFLMAVRRHAAVALVLAAMFAACTVSPCSASEKAYILAVLPQQSPVAMHAAWKPLADRLEQELGIRFKLKFYERMGDFEKDFSSGVPDFIFSTPTQAYLANRRQGYLPLVRGGKKISGVLFVRKDSPHKSVSDLKGSEISFIGSKNICSVLVRHELSEKDQLNFQPIFTGSTDNVFRSVLVGKSAAGAALDLNLEALPAEMASQLRPIMKSEPSAPHPISAHPRIASALRESLATAVLALWKNDEGKRLLKSIRLTEPVRADFARDYKLFERYKLEQLTAGE